MNLEVVRRTPGYAESQIRLLISDLKNQSHGNKIKAVKTFISYVEKYKPDVYDDDIDYLYTGEMDGILGMGLLAWCGADSEKHGGQLKRIAGPCIELLHNLVTMDYGGENLFYERFVVLPTSELVKVNFVRHITQEGGSTLFGNSRTGDGQDAMKLLAVLMQDHRTPDGNPMPLDIEVFFGDDRLCRERLTQYLQRSSAENISKAITKLRGARSDPAYRENRPKVWSEVLFKPLPLQEGEDNFVDRSGEDDEAPPVRDPLGLSELDLRATQQLLSRGGRAVHGGMKTIQLLQARSKEERAAAAAATSGEGEDEDEDADAAEEEKLSVLPTDKEFSASHFLTTVHPSASFEQLRSGLDNLCGLLLQQSGERDNLVRVHFGLFVHCVEGLDWLKAFRAGQQRRVEASAVTNFKKQEKKVAVKKGQAKQLYKNQEQGSGGGSVVLDAPSSTLAGKDGGEARLLRAIGSLAMVKHEVKMTLTPIVDRMNKNRRIRKTEKVLRRLAATLEYPSKMRSALEAGDLDEVIAIYQRVRALPTGGAMRILQKVVSAADEVAARVRVLMSERLAAVYSDYTQLLRLAEVVRAMDGRRAYVDCLHTSFRTHQQHFVVEMMKAYAAFCQAASAAHARALEQETTRKLKGDFGSERLAAILKSSRSGGDLAVLGVGTGGGAAVTEPRVHRSRRRGGLAADSRRDVDDDNASDHSSDDELECELDDLLLAEGEEAELLDGAADFSRGAEEFALAAAGAARLSYVQAVVDLVELWLPSLHALAATVAIDADQAISVAGTISAVLAGKGGGGSKGSTAGGGGVDKEYLKPSRDLGALLLRVSEIVKQTIAGYTAAPITFRSSAAGAKGWKALKAGLGKGGSEKAAALVEGSGSGGAAASEQTGDKMLSAVFSSQAFLSELPEPYLRGAIGEVSSLFESIEAVLLSVVVSKVTDSSHLRNLNYTPAKTASAPAAPVARASYYGDALVAFENVARDGDISTAGALTSKLLRYVVSKQAYFGTRTPDRASRALLGSSSRLSIGGASKVDYFANASTVVLAIRASGTAICSSVQSCASDARHAESLVYKPLFCERCVVFVEQLLLKALPRIGERVLRPVWVGPTVLQGVAKVLFEHVRLLATTYDSYGNHAGGAPAITKTGRDISDLVGMDGSLRRGADRSADEQLLLLDLLRALALLRSHVMLLLLSSTRTAFSAGAHSSDAGEGEGEAESEAALKERLLTLCLRGVKGNDGSRRLLERCLFHYIKCHRLESEQCVVEAVACEEAAVRRYVSARRRDFRSLLASTYNIIAVSEAREQWLERMLSCGDVSAGGQQAPASLPQHLSRVLLVLADEKRRLRHVWCGVTVEAGFRDPLADYNPREVEPPASELERLESLLAPSVSREKTLTAEPMQYWEYLLREVAQALLEEYASLAASLASGAIPGIPARKGGFALSAAKACEEMDFLRQAAAPLLPPQAPAAPQYRRDASRYPLAEQLLEAGRALIGALHR